MAGSISEIVYRTITRMDFFYPSSILLSYLIGHTSAPSTRDSRRRDREGPASGQARPHTTAPRPRGPQTRQRAAGRFYARLHTRLPGGAE